MTINTQRLREAAQRVIEAFGADWYAPGDWQETNDPLPYCDAHHIAAASPTVVIGLLDALDAQTAEIAEAKGQIEQLGRQNNALRSALGNLLSVYDGTDRQQTPGQYAREARAALSGESKC